MSMKTSETPGLANWRLCSNMFDHKRVGENCVGQVLSQPGC